MTDTSLDAFLRLVKGGRGHFLLESGHHGSLWLDLDGLFTSARQIRPFVAALSERIGRHDVEMICGPMLGGAFLAQLVAQELDVPFCFTERIVPAGSEGMYRARYDLPAVFHPLVGDRRVAIVDDVVSAGSALCATRTELVAHGAMVVAAGALLQLGGVGAGLLAQFGVPVEAVVRDEYTLWNPEQCPLCAEGMLLSTPAAVA